MITERWAIIHNGEPGWNMFPDASSAWLELWQWDFETSEGQVLDENYRSEKRVEGYEVRKVRIEVIE